MQKPSGHERQASLLVMESIYAKNARSPMAKDKSGPQQYAELSDMLLDILQNRFAGAPPDDPRAVPFTTLFSMAEMILFAVAKRPEILLEAAKPRYRGDALACHSLNVAFYSCKVGLAMGMPVQDLTELTVAALLHDIGMTRIDAASYEHNRSLSPAEREKIRAHPEAGSRFFEKLRNDFPWLLSVILEEHRRESEGGYPEGGGEVHRFSKIVGVCDSFEALSHERPFRRPSHPADAMKAIIGEKKFLYDKDVLRFVIEALGMYPVGSLVKLNNNKSGQVVETVPGWPLRPVVNAGDENDAGGAPQRTDLSRENNIYIVSLVYSDEYARPETASGIAPPH